MAFFDYRPSSSFFGESGPPDYSSSFKDINIPWNPKIDFKDVPETPGWRDIQYPSSQSSSTSQWNPGKDYLSGFLSRGLAAATGQYQRDAEQSNRNSGAWFNASSTGSGFNQLLPGFSVYQPESAKILGYAPGTPGTDTGRSPWATLGMGLAGSLLSPIAGAAGTAISRLI